MHFPGSNAQFGKFPNIAQYCNKKITKHMYVKVYLEVYFLTFRIKSGGVPGRTVGLRTPS